MARPIQLDRLFRRYPDSSVMREAAREWLRHLTRSRAEGTPLTGSYYWVPEFDTSGHLVWEVKEFYDGWLPSSDHVCVWLHVLDLLERRWKRNLKSIGYCSLPRGRVCLDQTVRPDKATASRFVIYHGNDCPLGSSGFEQVRRKFNLPVDTRAIFDLHEQMIPGEPESLSRALGIDLKLTAPDSSDLNDD